MTEQPVERYPISAVERDTGIGRDVLRVWERRYGFPAPLRNEKGERVYTAADIRRLQQIRRLLDQGLRPGRVVPLDEAGLGELSLELASGAPGGDAAADEFASVVAQARGGDLAALDRSLERRLARDGLRAFVVGTFAPLVRAVGEEWAAGRLEIFEEHLITRRLSGFLDVAMSRVGRPSGEPVVLLATLPGEQHALGLMMAEALLWSSGTATLNLGVNVPMDQVTAAVSEIGVPTVALSFSASYPHAAIRPHLEELAGRLPPDVAIWVGGEGVRRLRRLPASVVKMSLQTL